MATTGEQVRLYTGLTADDLPEDQILQWLELNDDDPRLAAADALETYAGTLTTITVTSDDISLDGAKRATALLNLAARLRDRAGADAFTFDVVGGEACRPELTEWGCC